MIIIHSWHQLAERPVDSDTLTLLLTRRDQMIEYGDLEELGTFIIVQAGDSFNDVELAVGFPILTEGAPNWEWIERHGSTFETGSIFEAPIVLTDDGYGHVLIVPDTDEIDPALLALCRDHA